LLTDAQIRRMAETYYAAVLADDEEERQEGTGSEPIFQSVAQQLTAAGVDFRTPFKVGETPEVGLSDREVFKREHALSENLPDAMSALAKGDITHVRLDVYELLEAFQINLDRKSLSYRQLGMAVLRARVKMRARIHAAVGSHSGPNVVFGNPVRAHVRQQRPGDTRGHLRHLRHLKRREMIALMPMLRRYGSSGGTLGAQRHPLGEKIEARGVLAKMDANGSRAKLVSTERLLLLLLSECPVKLTKRRRKSKKVSIRYLGWLKDQKSKRKPSASGSSSHAHLHTP